MINLVTNKTEMTGISERLRCEGLRIGCVPTMGALHAGHLSLVARALESADTVVATVFVNPTQFGPLEDFNRYPRDLEGDMKLLEDAGARYVFAPSPEGMYPEGYATWVTVERLTGGLCGASRPGHFRGVATVVTKLFNIVRPHVAVFGQKDAQQAAVIRRMARDLDMGVDIVVAPIVREPDGLAMSSRNRYLSPDERRQAVVLSRALREAERVVGTGATSAADLRASILNVLAEAPLAETEYIEIVDPDEIVPVDTVAGGALIALAVRFGHTRLIDNTIIAPVYPG
jgi:pantoate--beta-alanine ligase